MSSSDDLLKVLDSWKNSEGVIVAVWWTSGKDGVTFSFRGYVSEADEAGIHFLSGEESGNVSMTVSLEESTVKRIEKREVEIAFPSGARLVMSAALQ